MTRKLIVLGVCFVVISMPILIKAEGSDAAKSSNWSAMIHEENSILASVLYLPYLIGQFPYRIIDGIFNSKPTSRATIPPPAHQAAQ